MTNTNAPIGYFNTIADSLNACGVDGIAAFWPAGLDLDAGKNARVETQDGRTIALARHNNGFYYPAFVYAPGTFA